MIHYYDRETMVYTGCWQLPVALETTTEREDVTCPSCLAPRDAKGCRLLFGHQILMPNGKVAIVFEAVALPVPEVLVVFQGMQVRIPAEEVILL